MAAARLENAVDEKAAGAELDRIWQTKGPVEHAYNAEYRALADRVVGALVRLGAGRRFLRSEPIAIDLQTGRIVVEPDELAELPDGTVVLRRVRTGNKRSNEYDELEYGLYHLAGRQRYGTAYRVEALHLVDESIEDIEITDRKMKNREATSARLLAAISAGEFPPEIDSFSCPRCPHFFICAAIPRGDLSLK